MEVYFHLLKFYLKQQFMHSLLATYPFIVHFGLILAYTCNSENSGRITGDSDISCIV